MALAATLVLCATVLAQAMAGGKQVYNVLDNGAVGNGKTDDSTAFMATWAKTCADAGSPTFHIPSGRTFLLTKTTLKGPCKSNIRVQLDGNIVAPNSLWSKEFTSWIYFHNINGLTVDGQGEIDGKGRIWWPCQKHKTCSPPYALSFSGCNDLRVTNIKIKDSPGKHMTLHVCVGVVVRGLTITAPGDSINTDGIYVAKSQKVHIGQCKIGTGDDCISIGPDTSDINITHITCGPGHGISIGSLGGDRINTTVRRIHVSSCDIFDSSNGVRIKTWQGGSGIAEGILFRHINFTSVHYPIIIDQFYCPARNCPNKTSSVQLNDVRYLDLHGTSKNALGINLACSNVAPCTNVLMKDINIQWKNKQAKSFCDNVQGKSIGSVVPNVRCLSK